MPCTVSYFAVNGCFCIVCVAEAIRELLLRAANTTQTTLKFSNDVDDGGATSVLATTLYDHITNADSGVNVAATLARFFDRLFAAVYLHGAAADAQTVDCVASVRRRRDAGGATGASAFSSTERSVVDDLTRSVDVARVFVDALRVADVAARSLAAVDFGHQCSRALTRLRYCAACGDDVVLQPTPPAPCRQFCANVARGCLVHLVAGQTGKRWEHFIDTVGHFAAFGVRGRTDLENVLSDLPTLLSDDVTRLQDDIHNYHSEVGYIRDQSDLVPCTLALVLRIIYRVRKKRVYGFSNFSLTNLNPFS